MRETGAGLVALGPGSHMEWLVGFIRIPTSAPALLLIGMEKAAQ
jgi:hypothetical protein